MSERARDPGRDGEAADDVRMRPERPPGTPRWVKLLALGTLVLAIVVVIVMLISGGTHGPGRHASAPDTTGSATAQVNAALP